MNFDLADHHVAAQRLVREFAQTDVAPRLRGLAQARGEKVAAYGLTEPAAGSDAVGLQATAVREAGTMCSTGKRRGCRWPTSPIISWCSPGPTRPSRSSETTAACRRSWSPAR